MQLTHRFAACPLAVLPGTVLVEEGMQRGERRLCHISRLAVGQPGSYLHATIQDQTHMYMATRLCLDGLHRTPGNNAVQQMDAEAILAQSARQD